MYNNITPLLPAEIFSGFEGLSEFTDLKHPHWGLVSGQVLLVLDCADCRMVYLRSPQGPLVTVYFADPNAMLPVRGREAVFLVQASPDPVRQGAVHVMGRAWVPGPHPALEGADVCVLWLPAYVWHVATDDKETVKAHEGIVKAHITYPVPKTPCRFRSSSMGPASRLTWVFGTALVRDADCGVRNDSTVYLALELEDPLPGTMASTDSNLLSIVEVVRGIDRGFAGRSVAD
jgi:hypothetical protein